MNERQREILNRLRKKDQWLNCKEYWYRPSDNTVIEKTTKKVFKQKIFCPDGQVVPSQKAVQLNKIAGSVKITDSKIPKKPRRTGRCCGG